MMNNTTRTVMPTTRLREGLGFLVEIFGSHFSSLCLTINVFRGLITLRRNAGRLAIVLIGLLDLFNRFNRRRGRLWTMRSFDTIIFASWCKMPAVRTLVGHYLVS